VSDLNILSITIIIDLLLRLMSVIINKLNGYRESIRRVQLDNFFQQKRMLLEKNIKGDVV
jgi:hypothetical protein